MISSMSSEGFAGLVACACLFFLLLVADDISGGCGNRLGMAVGSGNFTSSHVVCGAV